MVPILDRLAQPVLSAMAYPTFDPVALRLGPLEIRWYALAYIGGLLIGWFYAAQLSRTDRLWARGQPRPSARDFDDIIVYVTIGVVLGGRLAYVIFYDPLRFLHEPWEIPAIRHGGMSFHGGFLGALAALLLFARSRGIPAFSMLDVAAAVAPIGLFLGRLANFIKPELWGRPTDVAWGMVFPGSDGQVRHPSQLYEAVLEGVVLFCILAVVIQRGGLRRPGLVGGLFVAGYGLARITSEFFREPDPQLGFIAGGFATMGMLLSLPMLAVGIWAMARAFRRPVEQDREPTPAPRPETTEPATARGGRLPHWPPLGQPRTVQIGFDRGGDLVGELWVGNRPRQHHAAKQRGENGPGARPPALLASRSCGLFAVHEGGDFPQLGFELRARRRIGALHVESERRQRAPPGPVLPMRAAEVTADKAGTPRIAALLYSARNTLPQHLHPIRDGVAEGVRLGAEMFVEPAARHPGGLGQRIDADAIDPMLSECSARGAADATRRLFAVLAGIAH